MGITGSARGEWFRSYFMRCFEKLNLDIWDAASANQNLKGMATTAVVCLINGGALYVTNIGDSRAWLIRNGSIARLTRDHRYVDRLGSSGALSPDEAREHPKKNMITKALGAFPDVEPDFFSYEISIGDKILLATDGLHDMVSDHEILGIVSEGADPDGICKDLVMAANERGGQDNITVVLAKV